MDGSAPSLSISRAIPECADCAARWVDPDEHWRWAPLLPDEDDLEPGEALADLEPALAWFCPVCWQSEHGVG